MRRICVVAGLLCVLLTLAACDAGGATAQPTPSAPLARATATRRRSPWDALTNHSLFSRRVRLLSYSPTTAQWVHRRMCWRGDCSQDAISGSALL